MNLCANRKNEVVLKFKKFGLNVGINDQATLFDN